MAAENVVGMGAARMCTTQTISELNFTILTTIVRTDILTIFVTFTIPPTIACTCTSHKHLVPNNLLMLENFTDANIVALGACFCHTGE